MSTEDDAPAITDALQDALAAEHAAIWGYGAVGAALPPDAREPAAVAERSHRDARDALVTVLAERGADPVGAQAAYELPFPVLSPVDAAALGAALEEGVSSAWVRLLGAADEAELRGFCVAALSGAEVRAVAWRLAAGQTPLTRAFPGLPAD